MPDAKRSSPKELLAIAIMWIAILAIIWPPKIEPGKAQLASDFWLLHQRRIAFVQSSLFGPAHTLPAWYPRELLGTPFWSNVQNFPFIPTRLLILFLFNSDWPYLFASAVALAAMIAALATYLYCRRIGLGLTASAAAGWTFVCNGYFISRLTAGHLPLLEAFWGLPLLLWIVETIVQRDQKKLSIAGWLCALALSCTALVLAGHPQLPFYSLACAGIYVAWRIGIRKSFWLWSAMTIGIGCASFAILPMAMLIGRSTRILPLAAANNDLALPVSRLSAFFIPWADGVAPPLVIPGLPAFHGYPMASYFWDTVIYAGWMPWLAIVFLLWTSIKRPQLSQNVRWFLIALGVGGIVLALPPVKVIFSAIPGTLLRSPVRLLYLTEFALAIALAAGIDRIFLKASARVAWTIVIAILIIHFSDLGWHDRYFIRLGNVFTDAQTNQLADFTKNIGDQRVGIDYIAHTSVNRSIDDLGFFDSIMLAKPYRWLLEVTPGAPRDLNIQLLSAGEIPKRTLALAGVKLLATNFKRPDLEAIGAVSWLHIYSVPSPSPRAEFFDAAHVRYAELSKIHEILQDQSADLARVLLLPADAQHLATAIDANDSTSPAVEYRRPDSDHIECTVGTMREGYLRILESWDPGWSATVDGSPAPIAAAMDALLAVPVPQGKHEVKLVYHTPGAYAGLGVSVISLLMLGVFIGLAARRKIIIPEHHWAAEG